MLFLMFISFYDVAVDLQKYALLTRSECRVSDTQVIVKAWGPLVYIFYTVRWPSINFFFRWILVVRLYSCSTPHGQITAFLLHWISSCTTNMYAGRWGKILDINCLFIAGQKRWSYVKTFSEIDYQNWNNVKLCLF